MRRDGRHYRIKSLEAEAHVDYVIGWFNIGALDQRLAMDSMRRFAEEVMPAFAEDVVEAFELDDVQTTVVSATARAD